MDYLCPLCKKKLVVKSYTEFRGPIAFWGNKITCVNISCILWNRGYWLEVDYGKWYNFKEEEGLINVPQLAYETCDILNNLRKIWISLLCMLGIHHYYLPKDIILSGYGIMGQTMICKYCGYIDWKAKW